MGRCDKCGLDEREFERLEGVALTLATEASDATLVDFLIENQVHVVKQGWEHEFKYIACGKDTNAISTGETWREAVNNARGVKLGVKA